MSAACRSLLLAVLVSGACRGAGPEIEPRVETGEIVVLAYVGLSRPEARLPLPPVQLVADLTSLAGESGRIEASAEEQLALARRLAAGFLASDAPPESLSLLAFDRLERQTGRCAAPRGSWAAAALGRLRTRLEPQQAEARVILIADIAQECEADLCQAGRELVEVGAWLDVVSLGSAAAPPCLRTLRPDATRPGPRVRQATPDPPRFRVESVETPPGESVVLAQGIADGGPVRVPVGRVRVVVELDGEESVGPFVVAAGERARVRIQSFPASGRRARAWVVDTTGGRPPPSGPRR